MKGTLKTSTAARILAAAGLGLVVFLAVPAGAKPDAVSAASLSVSADSVKQTTARISYFNDRYSYGSRTLCYNPAPAAPTLNCVTKTATSNSGFFKITGLTPFTTYNFSIKAINTKDQTDPPYTTSGSFKTLDTLQVPIDTIPKDTIPTPPKDTIPKDTIPTPPKDTTPVWIRGASAKPGSPEAGSSGTSYLYDLRGRKSGERSKTAAGGLVPVPSKAAAHTPAKAR